MNNTLKTEIKKLIKDELKIFQYENKNNSNKNMITIEKEKYESLLNDCKNAFNAGYNEGIKYLDEKVKEAYQNGLNQNKVINETKKIKKEIIEKDNETNSDKWNSVDLIFNSLNNYYMK